MINAIGAYNFTMGMSGYEVKPILYLVDSQGLVVWTDNHERMDHRDEDKTALIAALRKELQSRLDDSDSEVPLETRVSRQQRLDPETHQVAYGQYPFSLLANRWPAKQIGLVQLPAF